MHYHGRSPRHTDRKIEERPQRPRPRIRLTADVCRACQNPIPWASSTRVDSSARQFAAAIAAPQDRSMPVVHRSGRAALPQQGSRLRPPRHWFTPTGQPPLSPSRASARAVPPRVPRWSPRPTVIDERAQRDKIRRRQGEEKTPNGSCRVRSDVNIWRGGGRGAESQRFCPSTSANIVEATGHHFLKQVKT